MTEQATIPTIETEAELFDVLAKLAVSKVEFTYGNNSDYCIADEESGTAFDEKGNEIVLAPAIFAAAQELAGERATEIEWDDHEDRCDDWATVTFDVKARRVSLEGEAVRTITRLVEISTMWEPDATKPIENDDEDAA
jgi:hypothetical protein